MELFKQMVTWEEDDRLPEIMGRTLGRLHKENFESALSNITRSRRKR